MRKLTFTFLLSTLLFFHRSAQVWVTINMQAFAINENEKVFISGNPSPLSEWNPSVVMLNMDCFKYYKIKFVD